MNIFFLDRDPEKCAAYHCDKHVVKMILEYTQLLDRATLLYTHSPEKLKAMRLPGYMNHPCTKWLHEDNVSFCWLAHVLYFLHYEYRERYSKTHSWYTRSYGYKQWRSIEAKERLKESLHTLNPPQCMPDEYKRTDPVEAYRAYYIGDKARFAKWKRGNVPEWFCAK